MVRNEKSQVICGVGGANGLFSLRSPAGRWVYKGLKLGPRPGRRCRLGINWTTSGIKASEESPSSGKNLQIEKRAKNRIL